MAKTEQARIVGRALVVEGHNARIVNLHTVEMLEIGGEDPYAQIEFSSGPYTAVHYGPRSSDGRAATVTAFIGGWNPDPDLVAVLVARGWICLPLQSTGPKPSRRTTGYVINPAMVVHGRSLPDAYEIMFCSSNYINLYGEHIAAFDAAYRAWLGVD